MATLTLPFAANGTECYYASTDSDTDGGSGLLYVGWSVLGSSVATSSRLTNVTIPNGSTITLAEMRTSAPNAAAGPLGSWRMKLVANAPANTFANTRSPGTLTTAATTIPTTSGIQTVDLTAQLNEVVNQGSWASGNAICIVCDRTSVTSSSGQIQYSNESTFPSYAGSQLYIEYEPPEAYTGPTFRAVGSATISAGTAGITPTLPSWADGDRLLWFVETANQVVTAPSGLTEITNSPQGTGTAAGATATRLSVFTREMVTGDTAPAFADPGDHIASYVINVGPCDIDATAGDVAATASTTAALPALSTTDKHRLIVAAVSVATDIGTARFSAWTNGFTERADGATTQGNGGGIGIATKEVVPSGAVGSTQATVATSSVQGRIMIALKNKVAGVRRPVSYAFIID